MKRVVLESPYKGTNWESTEENLKFGRLCEHDCFSRGEAPFASHLLYTQDGVLDDRVLTERQLGIEAGFVWKEVADATVVYINRGISRGMRLGILKTISIGQEFEYRILLGYQNKLPRPMICTVTGASGVGKTTIVERLLEVELGLELITSFTSRAKRSTDLPGEYVHDVPRDRFEKQRDEYLWVVSAHENLYGTTKKSVEDALVTTDGNLGPHLMVLVPDAVELLWDHVLQLDGNENCILSFYILSPSEQELRRRLTARGNDDAAIERRVADCKKWDIEAINSKIPYIFLSNSKSIVGIETVIQQILLFC